MRRSTVDVDQRLAIEQVSPTRRPARAAAARDAEHQPCRRRSRVRGCAAAARRAVERQRARSSARRGSRARPCTVDAAQVAARRAAPPDRRREARRASRAATTRATHRSQRAGRTRQSTREQRAVAAEAGAERRQPPPAAGRVVGERRLEHEVDERARQVAVLAQHRRAVAKRRAARARSAARSASSTSRPPACRIQAAMSPRSGSARSSTVASTRWAYSAASVGTSRVRMLRSMPSRCSNISALRCGRLDQRGAVLPFDAPARRRQRLARQHRGAGAVAEQAGADQHARVVVEVHRGAADLDADRQHVLGRARRRAAPAPSCRFGNAAAQPWPTRS